MKTPKSANDLEPYFQPDVEGGGSGAWHEISQLSLTEPKVSSIEARVRDLEQWEFDWIEWHFDHEAEESNPEYVTYGDLNDENWPDAKKMMRDSDTEFLVKCCGDDRPFGKRGIKLLVTPSAGNHFVTVHDYISGKPGFSLRVIAPF
jgi:hypothetical protein